MLAGRIGAQVGEEVLDAGPGTLIAKPRGVPHAFWNADDEEARLLELVSPAGFERYFAGLAPVLRADGPPGLAALAAVQERYALTTDFASIATLSERYGLTPSAPG